MPEKIQPRNIFNLMANKPTDMWERVKKYFKEFPAQERVAMLMLKDGFSVQEGGKIFCGPIEISAAKLARAIGVDRRAINSTAQTILNVPELKEVFTKLKPAADVSDVAKVLGYGVIEFRADARAVGIIAKATSMIAAKGLSINQIISEDPNMVPDAKVTIVTNSKIPGDLINELLGIETMKEVVIR